LKITKLYIKYFDVVWNVSENRAIPVANLVYKTSPKNLAKIDVVPTVFIRNDVFIHTTDSLELDSLAQRVFTKIAAKNEQNNIAMPREIQLDCDWSAKTKQAYFCFLRRLKAQSMATCFSATIRLHQAKYPQQTGVPPVSRGMLMLYNMTDVSKASTKNSILDLSATKQYIKASSKYALPLDIALPAFRWSALFRGEKLIGLLNNYTEQRCQKAPFLHHLTENWWQCNKDTVIAEVYWRRGDRLRVEGGATEDIRALQPLVEGLRSHDKQFAVALFHCDSLLHQYYTARNLNIIFEDY
jgi:hypothetical protein